MKGRRSNTPLSWLLTGVVLLAAAALVRLLQRRRRPALKAVPEAIPVTPSYAGGAGTAGTWATSR